MAGNPTYKWHLAVINKLKQTANVTVYQNKVGIIIQNLNRLLPNVKVKHVNSYQMTHEIPLRQPLGDIAPPEFVHIFELNDGQQMTEQAAKAYYLQLRGITDPTLSQPLQDISTMIMPQSRWVLLKDV